MTMLYRRLLITIALTASLATAFHATPPQAGTEAVTVIPASDERSCCCCTRRSILQQALTLSTSAISITAASTANPAYADVIRSPGKCANGEGEGCDSLADNNELIRSLQKKSAENRESNQREALNAYYMKNYPDVFAVSDKQLIKKMDGSFALYSSEEVQQLSRQGKIQMEYPKSKGGRIVDLTQKPIKVLVE